jgi:hypothetical protein
MSELAAFIISIVARTRTWSGNKLWVCYLATRTGELVRGIEA